MPIGKQKENKKHQQKPAFSLVKEQRKGQLSKTDTFRQKLLYTSQTP